jgi:hypothetical protein
MKSICSRTREFSLTDPSSIRQHDSPGNPQRPHQAIKLNMASFLVLVFAAVAVSAAASSLMHGLKTDEAKQAFGLERLAMIQFWLKGAVYGGVSGACWMAMMVRRRAWMFAAQGTIALLAAMVLYQFTDHSWQWYLANTLGLVLFQTLGFHFFPPISWQWNSHAIASESSTTSQFSILDVIFCTIGAAALFTLMRLVGPGKTAQYYWIGLLWIWIVLPMISYCSFTMARPQAGIVKRISWFVLGFFSSVVVTILVSLGDYGLKIQNADFALEYALSGYGRIMAGYLLTVLLFAFAAWVATPVVTVAHRPLHS